MKKKVRAQRVATHLAVFQELQCQSRLCLFGTRRIGTSSQGQCCSRQNGFLVFLIGYINSGTLLADKKTNSEGTQRLRKNEKYGNYDDVCDCFIRNSKTIV